MKKLISLTILLAAMSASAITATKAYVDKQDAATYAAATNAVAEQYLPKFIGIDGDSRYYVDVDPDRYGIKIWTDRWPNSVARYGYHSALISSEQDLFIGGESPGYHIGTSDGDPNASSFSYINGYYVYRADGKFSTVRFPKPPGETNTLALVSDVAAVSNLVGSASADATEALNLASAVSNNLPTKVSQLTNDVGFITLADVPPGGGGGSGVTEATYTNLATIVTNLASRPFIAGLNAQGYPVVAIDDQYTNLATVIRFLKGE